MARRFALDATKMRVYINKDPLTRFDYDVQVKFPRDARPPNAIELSVGRDGWGTERIDVKQLVDARRERLRRKAAEEAEQTEAEGGRHRVADQVVPGETGEEGPKPLEAEPPQPQDSKAAAEAGSDDTDQDQGLDLDIPTLREDNTVEIRWWIGFTEKPIPDEDVRGVSILARGKLAQRPFMFEMAQGTEGQLLQEYLVGELMGGLRAGPCLRVIIACGQPCASSRVKRRTSRSHRSVRAASTHVMALSGSPHSASKRRGLAAGCPPRVDASGTRIRAGYRCLGAQVAASSRSADLAAASSHGRRGSLSRDRLPRGRRV